MCKENLAFLRDFYRLGVRMLTLTWNYKNGLGHPNKRKEFPLEPDTVNGLTPLGIEFLQEMERLGIIVDVSHLSDAGFYDVVKYAKKPFVASHSNARSVCGNVRNLTDDMLKKIADCGGVTGINFVLVWQNIRRKILCGDCAGSFTYQTYCKGCGDGVHWAWFGF